MQAYDFLEKKIGNKMLQVQKLVQRNGVIC